MGKTIFLLILLLFLSTSTVSADVNLEPSFLWKDMVGPSEEEKIYNSIEGMKTIVKKDPTNYKHYDTLAFMYDYAGLNEEAAIALEAEIKYYPDSETGKDVIYGNLAREYIILERLDEAKDAIDRAMEINPNNYLNSMHLVQYHLLKKQYKEAALAMKNESDLGNETDTYFNWYRYTFFDLKMDNSEVVDMFQYVVELDPESHDARRTFATAIRGDLDNLEKNFSKVIEEYKKALDCKPDHVPIYICIADTYMFMAMRTKDDSYNNNALEWFAKAYEIDPRHERLFYAMANFYNYNERHDEAILKLKKAISLGFNDEHMMKSLARAYNNKAYSLYQEGKDLNKGLEVIEKAIALNPNDGVILSTKAELLYKMGRFEEAYIYIKRGIALEPEHLEIKQDLENIENALKRTKIESNSGKGNGSILK